MLLLSGLHERAVPSARIRAAKPRIADEEEAGSEGDASPSPPRRRSPRLRSNLRRLAPVRSCRCSLCGSLDLLLTLYGLSAGGAKLGSDPRLQGLDRSAVLGRDLSDFLLARATGRQLYERSNVVVVVSTAGAPELLDAIGAAREFAAAASTSAGLFAGYKIAGWLLPGWHVMYLAGGRLVSSTQRAAAAAAFAAAAASQRSSSSSRGREVSEFAQAGSGLR